MRIRVRLTDIRILRTAALVLLGIPTFLMCLSYAVTILWALGGLLGLWSSEPPTWGDQGFDVLTTLLFVMWPVYIAWALFNKVWSRKEKALWILVILVLNLVGMPMFFIATLLKKRDRWTASPSPSRRGRLILRGIFVAGGLVFICMGGILQPRLAMRIFSDPDRGLSKTVIVHEGGERTVRQPYEKILRQQVKIILWLGASSAVHVIVGLWMVWNAVFRFRASAEKASRSDTDDDQPRPPPSSTLNC